MSPLKHAPYDLARRTVMADPSVRTWVKDAIAALEKRDPLDAADDAHLVAELMELRCGEILNRGRGTGEKSHG